MKKIFALIPFALVLVGCSGEADEGKEMTTEQVQSQIKQNSSNLPPEAQKAMQQSGRYGGNTDYGKSMAQAQGKG